MKRYLVQANSYVYGLESLGEEAATVKGVMQARIENPNLEVLCQPHGGGYQGMDRIRQDHANIWEHSIKTRNALSWGPSYDGFLSFKILELDPFFFHVRSSDPDFEKKFIQFSEGGPLEFASLTESYYRSLSGPEFVMLGGGEGYLNKEIRRIPGISSCYIILKEKYDAIREKVLQNTITDEEIIGAGGFKVKLGGNSFTPEEVLANDVWLALAGVKDFSNESELEEAKTLLAEYARNAKVNGHFTIDGTGMGFLEINSNWGGMLPPQLYSISLNEHSWIHASSLYGSDFIWENPRAFAKIDAWDALDYIRKHENEVAGQLVRTPRFAKPLERVIEKARPSKQRKLLLPG